MGQSEGHIEKEQVELLIEKAFEDLDEKSRRESELENIKKKRNTLPTIVKPRI